MAQFTLKFIDQLTVDADETGLDFVCRFLCRNRTDCNSIDCNATQNALFNCSLFFAVLAKNILDMKCNRFECSTVNVAVDEMDETESNAEKP